MKVHKALERAEEGQQDCYWHDYSEALRYLLVLPGVANHCVPDSPAVVFSQKGGRVTVATKEYLYMATEKPGMLPGTTGPVTVLLVL